MGSAGRHAHGVGGVFGVAGDRWAVANYGWRSEADIVGSNVAAGWRSGRVRTTAISGSYAATIGWLQCHDLLSVKSS